MRYTEVGWPEAGELERLVRAAQIGAPDTMDALLAALRPPLLSLFSSRLEVDKAEDLVQGTLLRVSRALHRIDPPRAHAYVATVARNLLRSAYRRNLIEARRRSDIELGDIPEGRGSSEAQVEFKELVIAVQRISEERLPAPLADIVLGVLRGDTISELAERQAVSPVTIRTRLFRARVLLRREMGAYLLADSQPADLPRRRRDISEPKKREPVRSRHASGADSQNAEASREVRRG